jgi:hypothetical protein
MSNDANGAGWNLRRTLHTSLLGSTGACAAVLAPYRIELVY